VPHPHETLIRGLYAARARRDLAAVRDAIAPDVVWHETGSRPPYTGDLVGRDAILAMMEKAGELTGGTFRLDLDDVLANDRHTVALVVWEARSEHLRHRSPLGTTVDHVGGDAVRAPDDPGKVGPTRPRRGIARRSPALL